LEDERKKCCHHDCICLREVEDSTFDDMSQITSEDSVLESTYTAKISWLL